ncbi:CoxG family protein [Halarchaeum nitratireducens]|uniref:Carbon monoxide dehydrogenase subunit G n=1 Tax=Halarchaeum nitratireducens TaxID=489913 RepID=A0A830G7Z9_9EURY|nr:hypothetical protein [Halarchaeum nitratireducens]GGN07011.1 hypothetical protein GCM10009021_02540 [Halarchaeum nitratireducens]
MSESTSIAVTLERAFAVAPESVWVALSDPVTTRECLPGCTALAPVADRELPSGSIARLLATDPETRDARTVSAGERYDAVIGAGVRGADVEIDVDATVTERDYPDMVVEGAIGDDIDAAMEATLALDEREGGCLATWRAEAAVGGRLAADDRRAVESTITRVAADYFDALDDRLAALGGPKSERVVKDPEWR